jgi:mRNA-degrading endonuclease toxin of MazEF toxin-antitoxin module
VANLDALRTIPRASLDTRIGRMTIHRQVQVKRALGHVLQWPEVTGL